MNHPTHLLNSNEPNNFFKFLIGAVLFIGFILFLLSCFSPKEVTRTHTYKSEQHSDRIIITVDNSRRFDFKWNSGDTHSSYEDIFLDSKLDTVRQKISMEIIAKNVTSGKKQWSKFFYK